MPTRYRPVQLGSTSTQVERDREGRYLLRAVDPSKFHAIEQIDPLLTSPWDSNLEPKEQPTATPKAQAKEDFQRWLTSIPHPSMVIYTDGSKGKDGTAAGAGWAGFWGCLGGA